MEVWGFIAACIIGVTIWLSLFSTPPVPAESETYHKYRIGGSQVVECQSMFGGQQPCVHLTKCRDGINRCTFQDVETLP